MVRTSRPAFTNVGSRVAFAGQLAAVLLLSACADKAQPSPPAPEVGFVTLTTQAVPITTELTGRLTSLAVSEVRPQVNGIIRRRLFEEGAYVRAGQALYEIDSRVYEASRNEASAQLQNAQAQLTTAQAKASRYEGLTEMDAVSGQDADDVTAAARQARASVAQAQAALRSAELNLGFTRITAPISGRIGRSLLTQGALVSANQADPLATIQAMDPIFIDITESSTRILEIRKALANGGLSAASASVTLILDDGTEYGQAGTITFTDAVVDEATGAVTIRARIPNPDSLLLPGMFVRVRIEEGVVPNGVLAPQQGISRSTGGQATAMVLTASNTVEQRKVVTYRAIDDQWLITSGLKAGDRLIVEGTSKASVGQTVRPVAVTLKKS
ncbi:MAG: efflux RND transporter periplasmic adaptor subunit [Brevundimonas sp.]|jgi:membrane fusion protein (multidrug efflux system)|uniref:efflux RND transporter periplasmic adaptor subunit n=1 Tax=Brevundimonas sp. TaxID=1871086 RepID=UPI002724C989|nr:efflux RND transporter periplasmic adaptor subunit [Brevundimonas sp.]MDO9608028.1 efflux RND transporter periplasmic adaptor subunit [Brevundimonas sp.]